MPIDAPSHMTAAWDELTEATIDLASAISHLQQAQSEHPERIGKVHAAHAQAHVQTCMRRLVAANRHLDKCLLNWRVSERPQLELVKGAAR